MCLVSQRQTIQRYLGNAQTAETHKHFTGSPEYLENMLGSDEKEQSNISNAQNAPTHGQKNREILSHGSYRLFVLFCEPQRNTRLGCRRPTTPSTEAETTRK
jgi:hypothetical protein